MCSSSITLSWLRTGVRVEFKVCWFWSASFLTTHVEQWWCLKLFFASVEYVLYIHRIKNMSTRNKKTNLWRFFRRLYFQSYKHRWNVFPTSERYFFFGKFPIPFEDWRQIFLIPFVPVRHLAMYHLTKNRMKVIWWELTHNMWYQVVTHATSHGDRTNCAVSHIDITKPAVEKQRIWESGSNVAGRRVPHVNTVQE